MNDRLDRQLRFVIEVDRLKQVFRQTYLTDASRKESAAEHSWHLAVMAALLHEYAAPGAIDLLRVVRMVVVHDVVEIDAGDLYAYDEAGRQDHARREREAAERIFGMLPADQAAEARALWEEFDARQTAEARFAAALDRLQPLLHNYHNRGRAWREHGVTADMVLRRNRHMAEGAPALWEYAEHLIHDAVAQGFLAPPPA
jgi:putative hydrolase of HD superfamily